jgi:hypothetical protein
MELMGASANNDQVNSVVASKHEMAGTNISLHVEIGIPTLA